MTLLLNLLQGSLVFYDSGFYNRPIYFPMLIQHKSCLAHENRAAFIRNDRCSLRACSTGVVDHVDWGSFLYKADVSDEEKSGTFPCVQTLRQFPKDELFGKVVMVRFESRILQTIKQDQHSPVVITALSTIKYLYENGAKIILVGSWSLTNNSMILTVESAADFLSLALRLKVVLVKLFFNNQQLLIEQSTDSNIYILDNLYQFKEERTNCPKFSKHLSSAIDIFVNDAFSQCHRTLASTVGVAGFWNSRIAGFRFEDDLHELKEAFRTMKNPYVAIIGGGNLLDKAAALHSLASICDGMVFVGNMAIQLMHVLGLLVPLKLVEQGALEEALRIVRFTKSRSMSLLLPKDFWCMSDQSLEQMEIFPASCIPADWSPIDLGPSTMEEISTLLSTCKNIIWIGPVKFGSSYHNGGGTSTVAQMLDAISQGDCDTTVVGTAACKTLLKESRLLPKSYMIENAALVWEYLKGRKLPGLMALDRACPFEVDWNAIYSDIERPLVVDIESGNGLFILKMARRWNDMNYLGLEINQKLVRRCVDTVHQSGLRNGEIGSRSNTSSMENGAGTLVEAISDLIASDGTVFLQSDIEAVALRMKEQFLLHGKGKIKVENDQVDTATGQAEWLKENPFGVRSDWEEQVIKRGNPMYRVMLSKSTNN